ncbi:MULTISPECIES: ABC transporter permease [Sphingobacterium]|uniref:ABC transporter permease n=1 Tax=Sphingobacterium litopenaei TaxID=2763500 RepID=A0ABR7YCL3_9SPHI|nr:MULTISPECIES: FtsX-like permease family protein [Sphingobacterium]MBD1429034.1 ABC transporter permease [Sphingobacterium litopenaei]NGM72382.1 FtsX-like permease family protein [Sphingobacterium sp. SGL-16]
MNTLSLVWKNITQQWGSTLLSILLTAFGVSILIVIYISSVTLEKQLENNTKNIDLVVGAKGSPMQLILSSLYHVDNPTGNIPLSEASKIAENPLVQLATPISLGDNYKGHRIIGTDETFLEMYDLKLSTGKLWSKSFEVVLGAEVAKKNNLKIGDKIFSAHGLSAEAHQHDEHPFTVVGILSPSYSVVDNLILSNLASVWDVHGIAHNDEHIHEEEHDHDHDHQHDHAHDGHDHSTHENDHDHSHEHTVPHEEELVAEKPQNNAFIKSIGEDMIEDHGVEITALLVKYSSPTAISVLPRMINQSTQMQAASPAIESSRIFSLLGVGFDSLGILAYVIMVIAGFSVFISLYNAMKDRKYDLAVMRTLGATKAKLFTLTIVEGLIITLIGGIIGLVLGHGILYYISLQTSQSADFIQAFAIQANEFIILIMAVIIGILASIIPAIKAYQTTISNTLSSK